METTPISSSSSSSGPATTMADGISSPAAEAPSKDYASWTWKQKLLDLMRSDPSRNIMPEHPESAALIRAKMQNVYGRFIRTVSPKLRPAIQKDSVKKFYQVCRGWSGAMGIREFLYPDILASMTSYNALRCAKVALEGAEPLGGRRADPNGRHRYGVTPLHVAAETFSVDMVKLLFQHGASANLRTGGELVIDGLLPLHVAVENTSMHKFLEDNWDDGDPVDDLIFLLSLPEMKMFLDTIRLIAKHTDSIVDEVWGYIDAKKIDQAAILLLAAQKQLRDPIHKSTTNGFGIVKSRIGEDLDAIHREWLVMVKEGKNGKALKKLKEKEEELLTTRVLVDTVHKDGEAVLTAHEVPLNGFDIVKGRIDEAVDSLHRESLAMIKEGKNGKLLKNLKDKKDVLLTAHALVGIVHKVGEDLEGYIQTHTQVPHEEIIEQVTSILNRNGIVCYGKAIDTRSLECYNYGWKVPSDKSDSQRVDCGETNEADRDRACFLKGEVSKKVLGKPPKGLAIKKVRNLFFPYWKSVISRYMIVKMIPNCQLSKKDLKRAERSRKGKGAPVKSMRNLDSLGLPKVASNFEFRRTFCAVAWLSRKVLTRT